MQNRNRNEWLDRRGARSLPGKVAFRLYDTYGFPLDLQNVIGDEQGFTIDQEGFDDEMAQARLRSQGSKVGSSLSPTNASKPRTAKTAIAAFSF